MQDTHKDRILILDFGGQTTQLIARRVREAGVYSELHPFDVSEGYIRGFAPNGIILSGGPASVLQQDAPQIAPVVFELGVPVLGICYGLQAMVQSLGGRVEAHHGESEFGHARLKLDTAGHHNPLFAGLAEPTSGELDVWMSHADRVAALPAGFVRLGQSPHAPYAAVANVERSLYGIQFHPEVTHTERGDQLIARFVHEIAGCGGDWTPDNIIEAGIADARQQLGDEQVLLALSGGVDSSVVAALLHRAIGDQLHCVFVDHGLLRLGEGDQVMATFAEHLGVRVIRVDAEARFMNALAGVSDPEHKRKIIGGLFIEVFEEEAAKLDNIRWLAQGTIYPDVIESAGTTAGGGSAHLIKSHHNVGGLPERMNLKLIEPLRELFKDEVRTIGVELGLPREMLYRHPFPGPGLGVRILGEVRAEYAQILRRADAIFIEALREHGLYDSVSQAFAVFLPVKSVGVTGDGRRHDWVIALRAVETLDFMTARAAHLPHDFLEEVARNICNRIPQVSRVTYDISGKPPATIEWE